MKIIRPCHNIPATKVKDWKQIKAAALELKDLVDHSEQRVEGYYKNCYAISHAQVSDEPLNFFVLDDSHKDIIKLFGSWCIINLEIIDSSEEVYWPEACMSFAFRSPKNTDRMKNVTVKYRIPFLFWSRKVTKKFVDLPAFICQHEKDHSDGKNIYNL